MISDLNKALRQLRDKGPISQRSGICWNAAIALSGSGIRASWVFEEIVKLAPGWPEHSGDSEYPVPAYDNGEGMLCDTTPRLAYKYCCDMFSTEHEYGRARLRLLDYLIEVTDGQ